MNWFHFVMKSVRIVNVFPIQLKIIVKEYVVEHCKECLDDIHYHEHQYRDEYDCERLLDYYVCRYSYKYCSEMIYALRQKDLSSYPYFHILSLGCGGAPDLMAFEYMNYENSPLLIIINDADSIYTGRDAFPLFVEEIKFVCDYCVAKSCESAQLILEVI